MLGTGAAEEPASVDLEQAGKELATLLRARAFYSDMRRELSDVDALDHEFEEALEEQMKPFFARLSELYWIIAELSAASLDDLHVKAMALNEHVSGYRDELITLFTQSLVVDLENIRKRPLAV